MKKSVGINVGAVSLKIAGFNAEGAFFSDVTAHEGDIAEAVSRLFAKNNIKPGFKAVVTGSEGRYLLNVNNFPEITCIEKMLEVDGDNYNAIVSIGGEDIIVYMCDTHRKIVNSFSGNKCATGTGEFFKQQLGRMDMTLDDIHNLHPQSKAVKLSKRCSVFMKSDCTHRLNKGQASKDDIVLSLSYVMASKIAEYLKKSGVTTGSVLLNGGLTRNKHIRDYLREHLPEVTFTITEHSTYYEALGAAYLAQEKGSPLPDFNTLFKNTNKRFKRYESLSQVQSKVTYLPAHTATVSAGSTYVLGVDGGSTTTKVCLVDIKTKEIVASHYGRTHGDPVKALKNCLSEIKKQIEAVCPLDTIDIKLISTTGSSREILGLFIQTEAVYNEILAHSTGTSFYCKEVDTIFEVGGQDAKYVSLHNNVAVDYAMNEACSAGTGSFLEEAASGDLNITDVTKIAPLAVASNAPLKFGEHCSAFINAEIRKAILQGASKEDITAGLVLSVVSNYLNRVVGNKNIGRHISVQGGVAKNEAIPLAFAYLLKKNIVIPPFPELLGCFGTALIAIKKYEEGSVKAQKYSVNNLIETSFSIEKYFSCKACDNYCSIAVLSVGGQKLMFGGRCNKYAVKKSTSLKEGQNYIEEYQSIFFKQMDAAVSPHENLTVGIPLCFSVYNLFPLYTSFFKHLGVSVELSDEVPESGVERVEADYCFPAEIAHGTIKNILDKNTDYIFVPHFKDMKGSDFNTHACLCPITQALPYYIKQAFPELTEEKMLSPEVSFKNGDENTLKEFLNMAVKMGFSEKQGKRAFRQALQYQKDIETAFKEKGRQFFKASTEDTGRPSVLLLGRPYNAFTKDANMGIPGKFISRGVDILPFDIMPVKEDMSFANMYWYYGRQVIEAAYLAKNNKNLYPVYISNFSCAPDSFLLHYIRWIMGAKPFLVLELDSHTADAGIDTRIEAFLDIVESYHNNSFLDIEDTWDNGLRFRVEKTNEIYIENSHTQQKIPIRDNPDVCVLLSNMGIYSTELFAAAVKGYGVNAEALPLADELTVQVAKNVTSGKECLPSLLVLGSLLQFVNSPAYKSTKTYLLFVPTTTGPCRTGQYFVFYQKIIKQLRLSNVLVFTLDADNSYQELGKGFSQYGWWALTIADYIKDVEVALKTCAQDKEEAMIVFNDCWEKVKKLVAENVKGALPALSSMAETLSKIPLKYKPDALKKILIVGEIYVRRDDFAVSELLDIFASKAILCKISGVTEWIFYCDHVRKNEIQRNLKAYKPILRIFTPAYSEKLKWHIEKIYKHNVEQKIKKALMPSGLLIDFPSDMAIIMKNCEQHFISKELYSEISISSGVASTALQDGYSGVVNISPFACLIGRVIEGIVKPWARTNHYPLLSVEIDGSSLPLNTMNKIDIFVENVLRQE